MRSQCEAEKLVAGSTSKMNDASLALAGAAMVAAVVPGGQLAAAVMGGASFALAAWGRAGG